MRRINEVIEGIRKTKGMTRQELSEKMGHQTTKDALDKHFENDSDDAWRIMRMCEILGIASLPSDWFLKKNEEE